MMLSDVCLSDVCRLHVHPVGRRRMRPAGLMARIGWSGPAWPAWLKAAPVGFRCRPGRGYIVAAARLQLVYFAHALNWMLEGQRVQVTRSHRSLVANRHCTRRRYCTSRRYRAYPVPCFIWFQLPRAAKLNYFNRPPAKNHETVHEEASTCLFYVSKNHTSHGQHLYDKNNACSVNSSRHTWCCECECLAIVYPDIDIICWRRRQEITKNGILTAH